MKQLALLFCLAALACSTDGGLLDPLNVPGPTGPTGVVDPTDGWTQVPGTGRSYILDQIRIADRGKGFDLDDHCQTGSSGCEDNAAWLLGSLGNDQLRQGLLGGESLLMVELAGVGVPTSADDPEATLKIYAVADADDPFFPANNFKVPAGHSSCCEFLLNADSLDADQQARARLPGAVTGHVFRSERVDLLQVGPLPGDPSRSLDVRRAIAELQLSEDPPALSGILGGVLTTELLSHLENPYCKTVSPRCPVQSTDSSLLELFGSLIGPADIDLDGDGLECLIDSDGDSAVDRCCDGDGGAGCRGDICLGVTVPPVDPSRPGSCVLDPRMADGYSFSIDFHAVPARAVGIAP